VSHGAGSAFQQRVAGHEKRGQGAAGEVIATTGGLR